MQLLNQKEQIKKDQEHIDKRNEIVLAKIEKGHFEADLVLGKKGKYEQAILTVVDIATRVAKVIF